MDTRTLLHIIYLLLFFLFKSYSFILFPHCISFSHCLFAQRTVIHLHMAPTYRRFFFSHKRSTYRLILQLVYFTSHLLFGYLGGVDCQDLTIATCFRALIDLYYRQILPARPNTVLIHAALTPMSSFLR